MKHLTLKPAFLITLALVPCAAMADSSVTLYGKLDVAIDMTRFSSTPAKSGQRATYLSNDISYWGLRGNEDLGGGTRAYFKLESGFAPDTGALTGGTQLFDRESYAGYGASWGSVQLGSQFTPSVFVQARSDPFSRNNNGSAAPLSQQTPGNPRGYVGAVTQPNAIHYISPAIGGVTAHILHGLSERAAAPKDVGQLTSVSVDYFKGGPLFIGAAYENQVMPGALAGSTLSSRTMSAGASYDFSSVKLFGYATKNTLSNAGDVNTRMVGINVPIGVSTIKATYQQRKIDGVADGKTQLMAIGYFYNLSKRTAIYTSYAHMNNGASTAFGIWPSSKTYAPPVVAGGSGLPVGGQDLNSLTLGIRHLF